MGLNATSARWLRVLGLALALAIPGVALSPRSPQASRKPIGESEIIQLLEGSVPPARVAELVKQIGINFVVTAEAEQRLRAAGATEELLEVLRERGVASPQAVQRFEQGQRLLQQGNYAGALTAFDEAEKLSPLWSQVHAERAAALDAMGNHAEAVLAWRRYLELAPSAPDRKQVEERILERNRALVAKGMEAFTSRRYGEPDGDNAIYWARQLRRVDPDHPVAKELESRAATGWENEAKAAAARQQFDQARQIYQKLAALFPDHSAYVTELAALEKQRQAALLLLRAEEALKAGRSGEPAGENAIELSRQVLQTDPANTAARELETRAATAYEGVARRAVEDNNRKRAVEIYTRLAALFPGRKEYRREVENLQGTSIPVVHYHELKRVFRFPLPVKLVHKGCWGSLSLTPRGLEFRGRGGNDTRVDDFVASAAELRARTTAMARPGALDDNFAGSGVHMTHIITLAGRAGETRFYVSAESANVFRAYTAEFWNWKWGNLEPPKGKKKQ